MDQNVLEELFKMLGLAIKVAERGQDASNFVPMIKNWLEQHAPEHLK
jgi:hypothetical protein